MSTTQVHSTVSGATGSGLGSVMGTLQGGVSSVVNMGKGLLDRVLPPETRAAIMEKLTKFAHDQPLLASFLLSHVAISGIPVFLFVALIITVTLVALVVGLLVGLLGAVLFILGAVGFALLFLFPVLFFTTFAAVGVWLFGVGAYYLIKWFNKEEVPGECSSLFS